MQFSQRMMMSTWEIAGGGEKELTHSWRQSPGEIGESIFISFFLVIFYT